MADRLTALGCPLSVEQVEAVAGEGAIGRPHVAAALVRAGHVSDAGEAFERYLGAGKPAYVEKFRLSVGEAVALIGEAGGAAVLAHPGVYERDDLVPGLKDAGIVGLEADHPKHSTLDRERYRSLAARLDLVATGGSDEHAPEGRVLQMGCHGITRAGLEALRARAREEGGAGTPATRREEEP